MYSVDSPPSLQEAVQMKGYVTRKRFERDAGLRIDHLLLNQPAFSRLVSAGVDKYLRAREKPSDHAPTWIVLSD